MHTHTYIRIHTYTHRHIYTRTYARTLCRLHPSSLFTQVRLTLWRPLCRYLQTQQYTEAIALIATLLRELKRLDDKLMLVEVHLLESRIFLALRNVAKSRVRAVPLSCWCARAHSVRLTCVWLCRRR
jgi:hypothetical protein